MKYGEIYSKVPVDILMEVSGVKTPFLLRLSRIYFWLFGYPDIAGNGRFPVVLRMLKLKPKEDILDAGCGNGIYANSIALEYGVSVVGYDIDKKRIEVAGRISKLLNTKAVFKVGEIETIKLDKSSFDKIMCVEVIEHIADDERLLNNFYSSLKKNGILVLSTAHKEKWSNEDEKKYFRKVKKGAHVRSGYLFNELKGKIEKAGFKVVSWEPYYRYFSRFSIKIQQKIYLSNRPFLNIITYPFLNIFSKIDRLIPTGLQRDNPLGWYRGFVIKAIKK